MEIVRELVFFDFPWFSLQIDADFGKDYAKKLSAPYKIHACDQVEKKFFPNFT